MVTVTVYSTPDCVQCRMTYLALERAGVGYAVVDLAHDPAARRLVRELGHVTAPVVVVDDDPSVHWSGFRPDRIAALR
jgi:glutaredoxin-like protein NrdH